MVFKSSRFIFSLADVHQSARAMLKVNPDGILVYRLLREVLVLPVDDTQLVEAKNAALMSRWVRQLKESQLPDGSWGRFHSQDTKVKTVFRTTEEAINRAVALGMEPTDAPVAGVIQYMERVLCGEVRLIDRIEKHEAFPLLIRFIMAGWLAQLDPTNPLLGLFWVYLTEVMDQAFSSGKHNLEDEAAAYIRLFGVHAPEGFLESQHALWILSSHPLPVRLERAVVEWIFYKPDGIRYLRAPLAKPQPRQIGYWLRSMNILSRFSSWREICAETLNDLWEQRDEQGWWDFGSSISKCVDFPLSDSWRNVNHRKLDYSTLVLVLLRKCFD